MQNNGTAHTPKRLMLESREVSDKQVTGHWRLYSWLRPERFLPVGMLKYKGHASNLQMAELKENIHKQFQTFPKKSLNKYFKMC
jgi:hypothetical protein